MYNYMCELCGLLDSFALKICKVVQLSSFSSKVIMLNNYMRIERESLGTRLCTIMRCEVRAHEEDEV